MPWVPDPPAPLDLAVEVWPAGIEIVRVHCLARPPSAFNPDPGLARFRPVDDATGAVVATLYAGEAVEAAFAETVFHDLVPGARRSLPFARIEQRAVSWFQLTRDLRLAQLHGFGLLRAGVKASELTDAPSRTYRQTARLAQAIYEHPERVDGIAWMSRQFNFQRALMLWGDRVSEADLGFRSGSTLSLFMGAGLELVSDVALRAGIVRIDRP
jgi:hypothetical protein